MNRIHLRLPFYNPQPQLADSGYLVIVMTKSILRGVQRIIRVLSIAITPVFFNIQTLEAQSPLEFEKVDKLPVGVFDMGYCATEKAIFSIGGRIVQGGEIKNTEVIMIYSPFTDDWSKALFTSGDIAVKGPSISAYLQSSNSIYTIAFSAVNEEGHTIYPIEVLHLDNYRLTYDEGNPHKAELAGIATDSTSLFLFGGYSTNEDGEFEFNNQLHKYNPATSKWIELSNLPEGRRSKGVITGNHLYVIGGETEDGVTAEVLKYNIATDRWSFVGYLPYASNAHSITSHKEYIFIIAGDEQADKLLMINSKTNDINQFDIKFGFEKPGISVIEDHLYLFGGYAPRSNTANRKTLRIHREELIR